MQNNRTVGKHYEEIAGKYLEEKGYTVLCYNYSCRSGEIDIVAKDHEELVFVEVKYRKNVTMGNPLEAVTTQKQKSICKCAKYYLIRHYSYEIPCRFDVVGIVGASTSDLEIIHVENAFDYQ